MSAYNVGYFVGSLATKSINRLLATALVRLAPPELHMTEISFKDLPLYGSDYDANYPLLATEFKNAIAGPVWPPTSTSAWRAVVVCPSPLAPV
jgi:chromate reductase, NAD(P)H dehydrogenase (quinone)